MNMRISLGAAIAFMLLVAAAAFSITMVYAQTTFNKKSTDLERRREMYAKFTEVDQTVRENYGGAINETLLMDSVAQGYIRGVGDKYGAYISAEEYKKLTRSKEGEDIGIGAVLEISPDGYLLVAEVYPDSPAQVAEISPGDLIVKVDDMSLTPENAEQGRAAIQGEAGTKLALVVRKGTEDVTITDMTRRVVAIPSVYSRVIPETGVGYLSIRQFNDNTADQFNREFNKVIEAGADCLIFDVRDNKGGSLKSAVRILDKLVPEGVIYSATNREGTTEIMETSDANEINLPMVVLTNAGTSAAAELFAQDLKDFGKASSIGTITAGKGVILKRIKLADGSAIDLTIATMNPSSGTTFDGVGVKPEFDVQLSEEDWTKLDETTDAQLKKAVEVVTAQRKVVETVQAESSSQQEVSAPPPPASSAAPPPSSAQPEPEAPPESSASEESGESSDSESSGESSESSGFFDNDPEESAQSESQP